MHKGLEPEPCRQQDRCWLLSDKYRHYPKLKINYADHQCLPQTQEIISILELETYWNR